MANKTKTELLDEIANLKKEVEKLERYKKYDDMADEVAAVRESFVAAGFTRAESFELIKGFIQASTNFMKK